MSIVLTAFFFELNLLFLFLQIVKFGVTLFVKDLGDKRKSTFSFRQTEAMTKAKWNLQKKDMVINYITEETMLMDKESKIPWRRLCKKTLGSYNSSSKVVLMKKI